MSECRQPFGRVILRRQSFGAEGPYDTPPSRCCRRVHRQRLRPGTSANIRMQIRDPAQFVDRSSSRSSPSGPHASAQRKGSVAIELTHSSQNSGLWAARPKGTAASTTPTCHPARLAVPPTSRACHPEAPILWRLGTLRHAAIPMLPTSRRQRFSRGPAQECSRRRKLWVELRSRASSVGAKEKYCATAKTAKLHIQSLRLSDSGAGSECRRPRRTCHPEAPILWRRGTLRHAAIPMLPTSRRQRFSRGPAQECSRQRKLWVELRSRASSVGAKEKYCATAKTAKLHIQSLRLSDSGAGSECRRPLRTCHPEAPILWRRGTLRPPPSRCNRRLHIDEGSQGTATEYYELHHSQSCAVCR